MERSHLRGSVKHNEHAQELRESLQISIGTSNLDAARDADVVILCVKPSGVSKVAEAIRPVLLRQRAGDLDCNRRYDREH